MAGAGYKLFQTGDVLTAAQVNTYLNEQTVMVFANAAARTSALTSVLAEGMVSYLQDTNSVEVYNGSSWVNVGNAGDITEVQAGTGISIASGTGPIPVITNTATTTIDAEGDLLVGDAADALQRLAIGSNGNVLTVDTSVDGKIKWAAPAGGGGKVLQVVQATYATETNIATTTWTDSGLSATITPSAATSKILVMIATPFGTDVASGSTGEIGAGFRILRGSTFIFGDAAASAGYTYGYYSYAASASSFTFMGQLAASYLDSPSTTSATTYKIQGSALSGKRCRFFNNNNTGSMILLEIGA